MLILLFLAVASPYLFQSPGAEDGCLTLEFYIGTMGDFPLSEIELHHPDLSHAGRLLELDMKRQPPFMRFQGIDLPELDRLCILREDLERLTAWTIDVVSHEYDGTGCVSFDEGMPHAAEFQRAPHNRGTELRIYPYRFEGTAWKRLSGQSGFMDEAFRFDCGVQVGRPAILSVMDRLAALSGRQLVRADGEVAADPSFKREVEIDIGGVRYWIGSGLEIPEPEY